MSRIVNKLLSTTGGVAVETDEFFNQTTLLLHGDGTNGSQNNTFLDSSSNNFTITRNGNTTQGSYSPYGDRWSVSFNGVNGERLQTPVDTAFEFGTGDFTVEAWVYYNTVGSNFIPIFDFRNTSNPSIVLGTSTGTSFGFFMDGSWQERETLYANANEWYHLALSRESGSVKLFVNGTQIGSTYTSNTNFGSTRVLITTQSDGSFPLDGYVSDARIVKGTALYTSNFTPPTEPLTAVSGTSLLTCQSNRFKDNSSNDFAITVNGDTKVTPFSPYAPSAAYNPATGGGSGYFDGAGDYLTLPVSTNLQLVRTQAFTVEAWIYPNSLYTPTLWYGGGADELSLSDTPRGKHVFGAQSFNVAGDAALVTSSITVPASTWAHVAVVCDGASNYKIYVNGVLGGSASSSKNMTIGKIGFAIGDPFDGYIADFRAVKGTALYTSNFTPPTAPLSATNDTSLLLSFDNAGIFDSTGKNVLETVGNAQIDTAVKKFGTGSMEFDGTGDWLEFAESEVLAVGGGDFTIEMWLYHRSLGNNTFFDSRTTPTGGTGFQIRQNSNGYAVRNGPSTLLSTTSGITTSQWQHFAVVRSGSTLSMYVDGVLGDSTTFTTNMVDKTLILGKPMDDSQPPWNGYIDDLRITKGVARYTANFTPPTKAFPDQ